MTSNKYSMGLDFGTNSARCLIVRVADGAEVGEAVHGYEHGEAGVVLDPSDPELARQHPGDYLTAMRKMVPEAMNRARQNDPELTPEAIVGIGVDATASTPIPVDAQGQPLALDPRFKNQRAAMAWLWKDHTAIEEAEALTLAARRDHPEYLAKCGGTYSSEWFFSKIWHCLKTAPEVFDAAATWVEQADWIPAALTGNTEPAKIKRGICAAGHKGLFHADWGGYPARAFLAALDPPLGSLREGLPDRAHAVDEKAGALTEVWAARLGLPTGLPVAVGAIDAHLGAIGSGIKPGTLVKIMGTSTCDMMVWPLEEDLPDIPGICGIVPGSILPGCHGLEAGQAAVGDLLNWFVNKQQPGGSKFSSHDGLSASAEYQQPGESGLLALDWNNGNRNVLADQRLTGLLVGQTLQTRPEEIYRALVEATAFGALTIIQRIEQYGVKIEEIVACGGIADKSSFALQIYADVTGRPMKVSRSAQTCALGSAICGAVVAGEAAGGYATFAEATAKMTGVKELIYEPNGAAHAVYGELFELYRDLHDAFGLGAGPSGGLAHVMKRLIEIRSRARGRTAASQ